MDLRPEPIGDGLGSNAGVALQVASIQRMHRLRIRRMKKPDRSLARKGYDVLLNLADG
jgi:hypothetical protein